METLFNNTFKQNCRERKRESEDDLEEYWKRPRRFMVIENIKNEELSFLVHWLELTKSSLRTEFCLNATNAYHHWDGGQLEEKFRLNKDTFDFNLTIKQPFIEKTFTELVLSFEAISFVTLSINN